MKIKEIIKRLYPFDYSISGKGNDLAIKEFKKFLPFEIHSFDTGKVLNGWKIPHSWELIKGIIKDGSRIIFDAKKKNLVCQFNQLAFRVLLILKS